MTLTEKLDYFYNLVKLILQYSSLEKKILILYVNSGPSHFSCSDKNIVTLLGTLKKTRI